MIIGLDFDNTLVGYDHLFVPAAAAEGWLSEDFAGTKTEVRDCLRAAPDGEAKWRWVQAVAYGHRMAEAVILPGVMTFLQAAKTRAVPLSIVSHKTRHPAADPSVDLHRAAWAWLEANGVLEFVPRDRVFFEPTRTDKVARIAALGCSHFVDDLIEVFEEPTFPAATRRLLLAPAGAPAGEWTICSGWPHITREVFGELG